MCGTCCFFVGAQGHKSSGRGDDAVTQQATPGASPSSTKSSSTPAPFIIPRQNKGLCTSCDVKVWLVRDLNLTIKWCKGCKNFRQWAAFGDKSRATKCSKCRERQKEKYAAQKEELKQKRKTGTPSVDGSDGEDNCRSPNTLSGKGKETKLREKKNESCNSLLDAAIGLSNMMNQQTNS